MSAARRMAAMLVACLWGVACVTTAIVEAPREVTELDTGIRSFLREPLLGYEGNIPEQSRYELAGASAALRRGEVEVARTSAETLLGIDPTLLPASVLLAQTHFAAGENVLAVDLLAAPLAARPGYTAGQLVYARAAERTGDAVAAYRAYRSIAALDEVAADRAAALKDEAIAELSDRIAAAIDGGGLADAGTALETLRVWAPGYPAVLDLGPAPGVGAGGTPGPNWRRRANSWRPVTTRWKCSIARRRWNSRRATPAGDSSCTKSSPDGIPATARSRRVKSGRGSLHLANQAAAGERA